MAKVITIMFFLLSIFRIAYAQSDSTGQRAKNLQLPSQIALPDGVKRVDSSFSHLSGATDSLKRKLQNFAHRSDTLKPELARYNRKLDSIKGKLTHRIDSLQRLGLSTSHYTRLLDSLKQVGPLKDIQQAEAKLASLESKINQPVAKLNATVNGIESRINEKVSLVNSKLGAGTNLLPAANLPSVNGLPAIQTPALNTALPNGSINVPTGSLPAVNNPLNHASVPGTNALGGDLKDAGKTPGEMKTISGGPKKELSDMKGAAELGKVGKEMAQVGQISNDAKGYSKDLQNIKQGNFDSLSQVNREAEKKMMQLGDMKEFQAETKQLDQYKTLAGKGNDPEALKALAAQEAPKLAVDHFAGQEKALQAAMDQMSKYKAKYPYISSVSDITKRVRNQMHGKPLRERILPGLSLQYQNKSELFIDVNPMVSYKISGRWTAGTGWAERIQLQHLSNPTQNGRLYGLRTYSLIALGKGVALRGEIERINAYVPTLVNTGLPEGSRQWIWGAFIGLKKDYRISGGIMGNIQTLYYLTTSAANTSPYDSKLNIRLGFEFPLKKAVSRIKKPELSLKGMKRIH